MSTFRYQSDPPVAGAFSYLRVNDLGSLQDGDSVSSWGISSTTGSPIYKNDSTYDFPYVQLNGGYFTLGQQTIQPSLGFTFVGYILTTSVGPQYPLIYSYAEGQNDGIRIYRTGGSGQDLVFRSQKAASIIASADDATTINTWQVFTSRVTDNGDSTLTMEIFIDNVLQGSTTSASSNMSGIVSGLLEVGQSTAWGGNPVSPIYISDLYFYDRTLSDTELVDMHSYFSTLGDPYTPPESAVVIDVGVSDLVVEPGVFFVNLTWTPMNLSKIYKVEYIGTDGSSGTVLSSGSDVLVGSLTPNTEYEFVLYSSDGGLLQVYGEPVVDTTLENLVVNYDATDFEDLSGNIDLTSMSTADLDLFEEHMNELFSTGDTVVHRINNGSLDTVFVNRGGTISTANQKSNVFNAPFDESAGPSQQITISTGTQDVIVSYNETTDQVVVDGTSYSSGESLVVDGKKMIVYNV